VDDARSALMHDKFMIIDGSVVWTGSWNYTVNDTYRNNNNALMLRSRRAVESYQAEFNEMFERREFGPRSSIGNSASFSQDGTPIRILFAPEDQVVNAIIEELNKADTAIRFMTFSFTVDSIAQAIQSRAAAGASVQGIFETTGSETSSSELTPLFCAGLTVRQDGNPFILHHKVFIVDDDTVITGSFNISDSATRSNDENLIIIQDRVLAAQYIAEFGRRWAEAKTPTRLTCS
jgi:phosphatidylserine/phosphatidylglycerophosphate/cardiolipin synthase-like enzyme